MDLNDIKKLTTSDWTMIVSAALGLICPGVLTIWALKPALITELTTPKIIVLAAAISAPVVFLNFLLIATQNRVELLFDFRGSFMMACLAAIVTFASPLGYHMFHELSLKMFLSFLVSSGLLVSGLFWLLTRLRIWQEARRQPKPVSAPQEKTAEPASDSRDPQADAVSL